MNKWMQWILKKEKSPGFKTGIIITSGLLFLLTVLILIFPAFTLEANEEADVSLASEEVLVQTLEESSEEEVTEDIETEEEEEPSLSSDENSVEISCEDTLAEYRLSSDELTEESTVQSLPIEETETFDELKAFDTEIEDHYEVVELVLEQPGASLITLQVSPREERKVCVITHHDDQIIQIEPKTEEAPTFQFQPGEERLFVLFEHHKDEGAHSDTERKNGYSHELEGLIGEDTDKTFDEVGGVYLDEFFMKNYNYMVFGNLNIDNQCDLGVLVQGDMISPTGRFTDFARSSSAVGPSYIGGLVNAPGAKILRQNASDTRENIGLYLDKSNNPLYENDRNPNSNFKLADFWETANQVGGTYFVEKDFFDWDHARFFLENASKNFIQDSTETIVVDNMASWDYSPWETVLTVRAGTTVTVRFEDVKNSDRNICYGFIDIVGAAENTENLPTIINLTGTTSKTYEQIFQLRYIDGVQVRQDNYTSFGQNLILNYPDATQIDVNNRLVFGHVMAPNASINLVEGDHFGCLVGKTITSSSTGHAGVTGHVAESPQTVTLEALKRVDDAVPTEDQIFTFTIDQYYEENVQYGIEGGFHSIGRSAQNEGETIRIDLVNLSRLQTEYWFRITEAASEDASYICDQTPYYARVVLKGAHFADPVYYREKMASDPDDEAVQLANLTLVPINGDAELPVFYNKTNRGVPILPETGEIGHESFLLAGFTILIFGAGAVLYRVLR